MKELQACSRARGQDCPVLAAHELKECTAGQPAANLDRECTLPLSIVSPPSLHLTPRPNMSTSAGGTVAASAGEWTHSALKAFHCEPSTTSSK
ncbi:hypothetical protein NQZ68_022956 [Dissostichus eleginoides]|nr:hypothetical protein NQZ68_022956 [Dissostichus eleginoides]